MFAHHFLKIKKNGLYTAPLLYCHLFVKIILDDGSFNACKAHATARTCELKITIPVEPAIK